MTTAPMPRVLSGAATRELLHQGRNVLLIEAVICLVGGVGAIMFPFLASASLEIFLGILCLVIGVLGIVRAITGGTEHRGSAFATGILLVILGVLLLTWPFSAGLEALTLLLAVVSFIRGFADLLGVPIRSQVAPSLQVLSGIAGILLGVMLVAWYPADALWAPGLLFGIQLVFFGMGLLALWNAVNVPCVDPPETCVDSGN